LIKPKENAAACARLLEQHTGELPPAAVFRMIELALEDAAPAIDLHLQVFEILAQHFHLILLGDAQWNSQPARQVSAAQGDGDLRRLVVGDFERAAPALGSR
jgi:hypothetical protein